MKYASIILVWMVVLCLGVVSTSARSTQADPTDDFSFTLARSQTAETYSLMPEPRVEKILKDRLDLFPKSQIPKLARHLVSLCHRYKFDPAFILSVIHVESGFHIKATSPVGALGLMQLMPATATMVARTNHLKYSGKRALFDPYTNLNLGVAYLAFLRHKYQAQSNSAYYMLAAYNVGPGRMDQLLARKAFRPTATKKYFEDIQRGVPGMRFYFGHSEAARGEGV